MTTRFFSKLRDKAVLTKALSSVAMITILVCASSAAFGRVVLNDSRSNIKNNRAFSWGQVGPAGSLVPNGTRVTFSDGLGATVFFQGPSSNGKAVAAKGISGVGPGAPPSAINGDEWDGNLAGDQIALWTNSPGQAQ